ncbi:MAG: DUF3343 domain-containing protein [Deltaproteobacteria bacterium]|uniref:DUF3343 domain-containing protein n=1 Tax=Candidatus Zymogenus saltonus TaxID=2844893 RepID=A0A9D8K8I2_9DELT|nr:DUF3343 domain-containing protein [Candidatus Zymogenus saltonus]
MEYAVVLMDSTSYAIKGERVLKDAGIPAKLIPVPRHLSSDCGVTVRIPVDDMERSEGILKDRSVPFNEIVRI